LVATLVRIIWADVANSLTCERKEAQNMPCIDFIKFWRRPFHVRETPFLRSSCSDFCNLQLLRRNIQKFMVPGLDYMEWSESLLNLLNTVECLWQWPPSQSGSCQFYITFHSSSTHPKMLYKKWLHAKCELYKKWIHAKCLNYMTLHVKVFSFVGIPWCANRNKVTDSCLCATFVVAMYVWCTFAGLKCTILVHKWYK